VGPKAGDGWQPCRSMKPRPRALNYYAVLGLPRGAAEADVRRAFHGQARQWHPDKCDAPEAAERFRLAREAFETLTSPSRRLVHDAALGAPTPVRLASKQPARGHAAGPCKPPPPPASARPLSKLVALVDKGAQGISLAELRQWCVVCGLAWPVCCTERADLLAEIARSARELLERRVAAREWSSLPAEDLAAWLATHGAHPAHVAGACTGTREQLIRLVSGQLSRQACPRQAAAAAPPGAGAAQCGPKAWHAGTASATPRQVGIPRSRGPRSKDDAATPGPTPVNVLPKMHQRVAEQDWATPRLSRRNSRLFKRAKPAPEASVPAEDLLASMWKGSVPSGVPGSSSKPPAPAADGPRGHAPAAPATEAARQAAPASLGHSSQGGTTSSGHSERLAKRRRMCVSPRAEGRTVVSSSSSSASSDCSESGSSSSEDEEASGEQESTQAQGPQAVPGRSAESVTVLQARVCELRSGLEAYRLAAGDGADAESASQLLAELEVLDAQGKVGLQILRATRIGVELNSSWWRRKAPGALAERAGVLVQRWMAMCRSVKATKAVRQAEHTA